MAKAPEKNPIEQLWEMFARETIPEGAPAAQQRFLGWCERNHAPHWVWRTADDVMRDLQG